MPTGARPPALSDDRERADAEAERRRQTLAAEDLERQRAANEARRAAALREDETSLADARRTATRAAWDIYRAGCGRRRALDPEAPCLGIDEAETETARLRRLEDIEFDARRWAELRSTDPSRYVAECETTPPINSVCASREEARRLVALARAPAPTPAPVREVAPAAPPPVPMTPPPVASSAIPGLSARPSGGVRPDKILISPAQGFATVVSVTGQDSDRANVVFRRATDDARDFCERDHFGQETAIQSCVMRSMQEQAARTRTRRAFCSRHTIYTEFGNFSMVGLNQERFTSNGVTYVRTDWKSHRDDRLIGNCNGCGTVQILETFRLLCPREFGSLFPGVEPY